MTWLAVVAIAAILAVVAIRVPAHAQSPTATAAASTARVFLPALLSNAAVDGATATAIGPNPTPAALSATYPTWSAYAGCEARSTMDNGRWILQWRVDAQGHVTFVAIDRTANGTFDYESRMEYRADGEHVRSTVDIDGNGTIDVIERNVFGGPGERWIQATEHDDVDGPDDHMTRYTFTGRNLTLARETRPNGDLVGWEAFHYEGGKLVRTDGDLNGDNKPELTTTRRWDGDLLVEDRLEEDDRGSLYAQVNQYQYDELGRLVAVDRAEIWSDDEPAPVHQEWRYTYGPLGYVSHTELWDLTQGKGVLDMIEDNRYENGRLSRTESRRPGGPVYLQRFNSYDCSPGAPW